MTPKQQSLYWREWSAVKRAQPDADRHAIHAAALGAPKSSKAFTNEDLDKVLRDFRAISQPANLHAQLRQIDQPKTRFLYKILHTQSLHLRALNIENPTAYIHDIASDKFSIENIHHLTTDPRTLHHSAIRNPQSAIGPSDLEMLRNTLARAISKLRQAEGITVHELNMRAGVRCDCAPCNRARLHIAAQDHRRKTEAASALPKHARVRFQPTPDNPF